MSGDSSKTAALRFSDSFLAVLVVLAAFVILQFVASILLFAIFGLFGVDSTRRDTLIMDSAAVMFVFLVLFQGLGYWLLWAALRRARDKARNLLGLLRPKWIDLGYILVGGVVYVTLFIVVVTILRLITGLDVDQEQAIGFSKSEQGLGLVLAFLSLVVLTPIFEELFFRGFLYGKLRRNGFTILWSVIVTSGLFGLLHLFGGVDGIIWIAAVDTLILSFVLCIVRERSGRIWASIGIHAAKNGLAFVTLFLLSTS